MREMDPWVEDMVEVEEVLVEVEEGEILDQVEVEEEVEVLMTRASSQYQLTNVVLSLVKVEKQYVR